MKHVIMIGVCVMCISSCASNGVPTAAESAAAPVVAMDESATAPEAPARGEISQIDSPMVEQTSGPTAVARQDERICRREMRTGSHRAMRVCRTRAEIERMEEESKDTFKSLHDSQTQPGSKN